MKKIVPTTETVSAAPSKGRGKSCGICRPSALMRSTTRRLGSLHYHTVQPRFLGLPVHHGLFLLRVSLPGGFGKVSAFFLWEQFTGRLWLTSGRWIRTRGALVLSRTPHLKTDLRHSPHTGEFWELPLKKHFIVWQFLTCWPVHCRFFFSFLFFI